MKAWWFIDTPKTTFESILRSVNSSVQSNEKVVKFNYWNYALNWSFIDAKNDEHTPKNGHFYQKNDENILWSGDFINTKHMKTY